MSAISDLQAAVTQAHETQVRTLKVLTDLKAAVDSGSNDPALVAISAAITQDSADLNKALDVAQPVGPNPLRAPARPVAR